MTPCLEEALDRTMEADIGGVVAADKSNLICPNKPMWHAIDAQRREQAQGRAIAAFFWELILS